MYVDISLRHLFIMQRDAESCSWKPMIAFVFGRYENVNAITIH